ncbi:MAG: hypothetical protein U1B83_03220, partial [Candidatus Cloacimonadaceae bacterium]|nr:hypothetical protein [Candidatus Cloacimonadaceae bacterium]
MNKAFFRPLIILLLAVIMLGAIASFLPAWENDVFPIKSMTWFRDLFSAPMPDSLALPTIIVPIESELLPLDSFTVRLQSLKSNPRQSLRIGYFGDSIIEGDLISGRLRSELQKTYGGSGVGLVPVTSIVNEFRKTIRHSFSRNWETVSFMSAGSVPVGMIGYAFIPRNYYMQESVVETTVDSLMTNSPMADSIATPNPSPPKKVSKRFYTNESPWVEYAAANVTGGSTELRRIRLFYSNAGAASYVNVSHDDAPAQRMQLTQGEEVQVLDLSAATPIKKIRLTFSAEDPIHVYGVSFDDHSGVYVDNLSVRGFSGMYFQRIPEGHLAAFHRALDYDLIILQYGENVSRPDIRDYGFYTKGMTRTIRHIQSALGDVPILVISAHDRSIRKDGIFQTSPDIPILV